MVCICPVCACQSNYECTYTAIGQFYPTDHSVEGKKLREWWQTIISRTTCALKLILVPLDLEWNSEKVNNLQFLKFYCSSMSHHTFNAIIIIIVDISVDYSTTTGPMKLVLLHWVGQVILHRDTSVDFSYSIVNQHQKENFRFSKTPCQCIEWHKLP